MGERQRSKPNILIQALVLILVCVAPIVFLQPRALPAESAAGDTFYRDVLPILQNHCQSCHRAGEIGMMPLLSYEQARPLARAIANSASQKKMPPWFADPNVGHFSNDPSLNPQEIATLVSWADANAPAGDPHNAPPPRQWAKGWVIPQPDMVFQMPKAVTIPAHGDVEYTYEIVPTHFTRPEWVQFCEVRPRSRENVHHAVVYVRPPGSHWLPHAPIGVPFTGADMTDEQDRNDTHFSTADILLVYAPGSSPDNWGRAWRNSFLRVPI